ncbi:unnamed protein product [Paramecium octaurelia]|uniref:RRM domain-containing protein n=1 Tax=Paramecium octaurelia TaxID=43137 RepID=A0A8S1TYY8_PAROT|nr:unnamed protein product [Paramecium octaurelia]
MSNHEDDLEVQEPVDQQKEDESQKKGGTDNKHQLKDIDLSSIFVRNLDENTTEDDLKEYFKDCGNIVKVTLRSDKNTGTLYSYIQFQDQNSVEDALVLSEGIIRGKKILVFQKRTNLRNRGRGNRGGRGQPFQYITRGRYLYAEPIRGRGAYRGGK